MQKNILVVSIAAVAAIVLVVLPYGITTSAENRGAVIWGTWYLELDTAAFGIPGGTLPSIVSFHRDGTFNISDGGDFGGLPFTTRHSPQYGSWAPAGESGHSFVATSLFLEADGMTLNCPNPVTTDGTPVPPFDFPIQLTRLRPGNS